MTDYIYKWLEAALDIGILEKDFWDMTLLEVDRALKSYERVKRREAQEKASYDYILADLIGRSVARVYHSTNKIPPIYEAYPGLFDNKEMQEKQQEKKDKLSALRFRQFANAFNKKKCEEVDK